MSIILGKFSKDLTVNNMERNELDRYIYYFSVHCDTINANGITDICKYFLQKQNIHAYIY